MRDPDDFKLTGCGTGGCCTLSFALLGFIFWPLWILAVVTAIWEFSGRRR